MGMFDEVNFEMPCPNCGARLDSFQTKDLDCTMDKVEPDNLREFYTSCKCGNWVELIRPNSGIRRRVPLTLAQVEAMGFVLHSKLPAVPSPGSAAGATTHQQEGHKDA